MTIYTRSLQQIGSSILISLPTEWIKKNFLSTEKCTAPKDELFDIIWEERKQSGIDDGLASGRPVRNL